MTSEHFNLKSFSSVAKQQTGSTSRYRPVILTGLAILSAISLAFGAQQSTVKTFEITLTDLTNQAANSGQPFSPPVFVTHNANVQLWEVGAKASLGIQNIAEGGNRDVLVDSLKPLIGGNVLSLVTPLSAPMVPGTSVIVRVQVDAAHPLLSHAWMLGRTNDGFGGQNGINVFDLTTPKTYTILGLDAGTEINSEKNTFLGALGMGNNRDPENGVIRIHDGIIGKADAPLSWNWSSGTTPANQTPVARVTITPVTANN